VQQRTKKLYLILIGEVDRTILQRLAARLEQRFGVELTIGERLPLPQYAYNIKRRQYNSTRILEELEKHKPKDAFRVLGIVDVDLYVPGLNFVFGEADPSGGIAVMSLVRLRPESYGLPSDENLFLRRASTEAVHELGHTFGLEHCQNPHCVMFFSNSLSDTDRKRDGFCEKCGRVIGCWDDGLRI